MLAHNAVTQDADKNEHRRPLCLRPSASSTITSNQDPNQRWTYPVMSNNSPSPDHKLAGLLNMMPQQESANDTFFSPQDKQFCTMLANRTQLYSGKLRSNEI